MWFAFVLLWMALAWALLSNPHSAKSKRLRIHAPAIKRSCASQWVSCVDDCSFLCIEPGARCVGGVCQTRKQNIACQRNTGGVLVLNDGAWTCLCTDNAFYSGPDCGDLNPDVCEHGTFLYSGRDNFYCVCPSPYTKVALDGKPHCLEPWVEKFLPQSGDWPQGPSELER